MKKFGMIFAFLIIYVTTVTAAATEYLIPGGQVIGLELQDNTVTVAAIDADVGAAAKAAGMQEGDRILRIGNTQVQTAEDVRNALQNCQGRIPVTVLRDGKTKTLSILPTVTGDGPKLGIYLKQGTTGVGTVTYYDENSGSFAALGHGVNTKNGNLLQLTTGRIYTAKVDTVKKGTVGTPGQLMGTVTKMEPVGTIAKNTDQGVFGKLPSPGNTAALPIADRSQIHTGKATIRSTVKGQTLREYSVEILKIYPKGTERTRNMLLKITDPALLNATGGIVQGMGVSYNKDNQWNP